MQLKNRRTEKFLIANQTASLGWHCIPKAEGWGRMRTDYQTAILRNLPANLLQKNRGNTRMFPRRADKCRLEYRAF